MIYIESDLPIRYATALFNQAEKGACLEDLEEQLTAFCMATRTHPDWLERLHAPKWSLAKKKAFVDQALASWALPLLKKFIHFLLIKRRIDTLYAIEAAFKRKCRAKRQEVLGKLVVSAPITASNKKQLIDLAQKMYPGKQIKLAVVIDKSLIGGYRLTLDGTTIDTSIKSKMARLAISWQAPTPLLST